MKVIKHPAKEGSSKVRGFRWRDIGKLLARTFKEWNEEDPFRHSAIIAFYAIFSLPALIIIVVNITGYFVGEQAVEGEISGVISEMIGKEAAQVIENMVASHYEQDAGTLAAIIGIGTLLFGATSMFVQLQKSLNDMWGVRENPKLGLKKLIIDRITSLGIILMIGFLLLISFMLTSLLSILSDWIMKFIPEVILYVTLVFNFVLAFAVVTVLFALIFKVLPDVRIRWKTVWIGAIITAILFEIGKFALSLYFGIAEPGTAFGVAGSFILILLWISYSCLILFFGAEFTKVFAEEYGHGIEPTSFAIWSAKYKEKHAEDFKNEKS
jgi:membrane protein